MSLRSRFLTYKNFLTDILIGFQSSSVDRLESELMSELENARLVRLLCKFGFINERPEYGYPICCSFHASLYIFCADFLVSRGGPKPGTDISSNYSVISSSIK